MSDHLLLWETFHRWPGGSLLSHVSTIDHLIDSQRRFQSMLADSTSEVFYSRTDLRMFIDKCRTDARTNVLAACNISGEGSNELVLHAAAKLKVSPLNTAQLIKDYPGLIRKTHPEGPLGSTPLHIASASVGSDHIHRVTLFLNAYPGAVKRPNERGLFPMQLALINGAEFDVMKLLVEAFPPALEYPFFPRPPVSNDLVPLVGLLPFHIACCRNYSLDVIFQLLLECPDSVSGEISFEKALGKLSL